jgi:sodium transport system permease protein
MLTRPVIIACKELADHCRDTRSLISSTMYALMGPAVVLLVLVARDGAAPASGRGPWPTMAAVFAVVAVFTSVAAMATDMIAGERERRSLLPLVGAVPRRGHVVVGKWFAATAFGAAGLLLNVLAFGAVFAAFRGARPAMLDAVLVAPALLPLALLAASLAIGVSTACRNTKEANTWWSMLTFVVMGVSMWLAFQPDTTHGWTSVAPILGQQRLLEWGFAGAAPSLVDAAIIARHAAVLGATTAAAAGLVLAATWILFRRDEAVYGA